MAKDLQIGVLSLQGSVKEHISMLSKIKMLNRLEVRSLTSLESVDGIILPGGESTTISKLLIEFGLFEPLKQRIKQGLPVWGTCAGMILLAKDVIGENPHLGLMNITVRRNAYGRQINSFTVSEDIPAISEQRIPLTFIRAPWIENIGKDVEVLCHLNKHSVAAKEREYACDLFSSRIDRLSCRASVFYREDDTGW